MVKVSGDVWRFFSADMAVYDVDKPHHGPHLRRGGSSRGRLDLVVVAGSHKILHVVWSW